MALPHSPEEKELTEGDPGSPESSIELIESTPIAIEHAQLCKAKWRPSHRPIPRVPKESLLSNFYLTNPTVDCTAPLVAQ